MNSTVVVWSTTLFIKLFVSSAELPGLNINQNQKCVIFPPLGA